MQSTRDKLIDTARQLFAERGVEHVSLREISRAAEQGNVSALQYHFGDREGLLRGVMEPYHREVDARRHALMDHLDANGAGLRDYAGALVRPPAALLADPGGRQFLRIFGHLLNHPAPRALSQATGGEGSSFVFVEGDLTDPGTLAALDATVDRLDASGAEIPVEPQHAIEQIVELICIDRRVAGR